MKHKRIFGVVTLFLLLLTVYGVRTYKVYLNEITSLRSHCDCECMPIEGAVGAEDIDIDRRNGIALISSFDRRARQRGEDAQGAILAYDLQAASPELVNLTADLPFRWQPHGLHLYQPDEEESRLFVVNHHADGTHAIEVFRYHDMTLVHLESITDEVLLTDPNDVVAVGPREFYVTNLHGFRSSFGRLVEDLLILAKAYVLYYDGTGFRKVAEQVASANGITATPDGTRLYVASTTTMMLKVYQRNRETGDITHQDDIDLGLGVDNLNIDDTGVIWAAGHPKLIAYISHAGNAAAPAPSQALRISFEGAAEYAIETVYLNTGEEISGSSAIAPYKNVFVIGSVFEKHALLCKY